MPSAMATIPPMQQNSPVNDEISAAIAIPFVPDCVVGWGP